MKLTGTRTTAALLVPIALVALVGCSKKKDDSKSSTSTTAAAASTAAASSAPADAASGSKITIKGFTFTPAALTVKAGTEVTVTNTATATHTFTSVSGPAEFDTGDLAEGASGKVTFAKAGTYEYHCNIHNSMTGSVVVS